MTPEQEALSRLIVTAAGHIQRNEFSSANRLLRESLPQGLHPGLTRGLELWRGNRPRLAARALQDHMAHHPDDWLALQVAGHIASQLGAIDQAIEMFQRCFEGIPGIAPLRLELCNLFARRQRYVEALEQADSLLAEDPHNRQYRMLKAALLDRSGQYEPAIGILKNVLDTDLADGQQPREETAAAWTALGMIQRTCGDQPAAIDSLRKAVHTDPTSGWPWFQLSDFKVIEFSEPDLDTIKAGLENARPGSMNEVHFSFALGRALESQGDTDAAFDAYLRGNRVRAAMAPFDMQGFERELNAIRSVFNSGFLSSPAAGDTDCPAIFVVGLPRSGTTLVDQVITAHSQVDGTMELPLVTTLIREFQQRQLDRRQPGYPVGITRLAPEELRQMGVDYLQRAEIQRGQAPLFVDKMPFNFQHVGLIRLILPGARIINVQRNPMATGFSIFRQLFRFGQDWAFGLESIARYYQGYARLMQHWNEVLPGFVHTIRYEDLVSEPDPTISSLLAQLGLADEAACHKPHENLRPVRTASSEQVRQALYTDAVDYWRRFEKHLEPMRLILETSELGT